jgi:hypothetical protein
VLALERRDAVRRELREQTLALGHAEAKRGNPGGSAHDEQQVAPRRRRSAQREPMPRATEGSEVSASCCA